MSRFKQLHWLECEGQRLALCPEIGGSIAAWQWRHLGQWMHVWRTWRGLVGGASLAEAKVGDMACFPMVPWSNRIGGGGFVHDEHFYPLQPNTAQDPYPIHGDAWQQSWTLCDLTTRRARMVLHSRHHLGSPYHYCAEQTLELGAQQLLHHLRVQNNGDHALPFGLGLHPWLNRTPNCKVTAPVAGVWISDADRLPTALQNDYPKGWDLNRGVKPHQVMVDNAYAGWSGVAQMAWPEHNMGVNLKAALRTPQRPHDLGLVLYSPQQDDVFCLEPVSHPINAAHLPSRPGWVSLEPGEALSLLLHWRLVAL